MNTPAEIPPRTSFFARLFSWPTFRRVLLAFACLVTLIALFYTEEDLRGKFAWEKCRRALEAKGVDLNWSSLIPPQVPDDQNFFKTPGINEDDWIGRGSRPLSAVIENARSDAPTNSLLIAEVSIVPSGDSTALPFDNTNTSVQIRQRINLTLGPISISARQYAFSARTIGEIHPARVNLSSDKPLTAAAVASLFPDRLGNQSNDHFRIEPTGSNAFRVLLQTAPEPAADFLAHTRTFEPTLDVIRNALERPYQRMDGDYSQNYNIPIPNFVMLRSLAQLLADRAKCHLLLHAPGEAVRDLLLLHDICLVTESKPTGRPMTLVAAMIHVAIIGLYADTVAEGFQTHAWQENQLVALQDQIAHTDLMPFLVTSLGDERVFSVATLEKTRPDDLFKAVQSINGGTDTWRARLRDPLYCFTEFAPRGWLYQNLVHGFSLHPLDEIGDASNHLVSPGKAKMSEDELNHLEKSPYTFLITLYRPNGPRAWRTLAHNQNQIDEALIACALERFRLAHGDYPETLDALIPQFIDKLPHDIIGGQPLHYRRQPNDTFLLYSIGWNETDDGAIAVDVNGSRTDDAPDWVWPNH